MPRQLALPLRLEDHATFETLVDGDNGAALAHVHVLVRAGAAGVVWLWGPSGCGKSHVLQAACREADRAGKRTMYLPLGACLELGPTLLGGLDALGFLALDQIEHAAGRPEWESALFEVLNGFQFGGSSLVIAADRAPSALEFALPDLASRAAGAAVYRLHSLDEHDQLRALGLHARRRGLTLTAGAARFLQSRVPRDMKALCAWLARLDAASLAAGRRITIPFIRDTLETAGRGSGTGT